MQQRPWLVLTKQQIQPVMLGVTKKWASAALVLVLLEVRHDETVVRGGVGQVVVREELPLFAKAVRTEDIINTSFKPANEKHHC